jgi:DNA-directed RNA polymerase subunit RPC12/RpoP
MKNDPDEIRFGCPKCKRPMSGDQALLGEMINCPDCGESFRVALRNPSPKAKPEDRTPRQCPACGKVAMLMDSTLLEETVTCPDCNKASSPKNWTLMTRQPPANSQRKIEMENRPQQESDRAKSIRARARFFSYLAILGMIMGGICGAFAIMQTVAMENPGSLYFLSGSLLGLALWLYLIAQIIHIRANTEK